MPARIARLIPAGKRVCMCAANQSVNAHTKNFIPTESSKICRQKGFQMTEKQASSEIAQSRERFEKWLRTFNVDVADQYSWPILSRQDVAWQAWQAVERGTRERLARIAEDRAEILRNTKCQAETSVHNFDILDACQGELESLAERIRGKEVVDE
jgi:hypothetical protein